MTKAMPKTKNAGDASARIKLVKTDAPADVIQILLFRDVLRAMQEDIEAARQFVVAAALLTQTLDAEPALIFQRIAGSAINHVDNIGRQIDELQRCATAA
jgi:hypothetical protein